MTDAPAPTYHRLDADAVVEAVAGGERPEEYADRLGLPRGDVLRALRRRVPPADREALFREGEEARARTISSAPDRPRPASRYSPNELERARVRYVTGATYADLGRGFGVTADRARTVMLRSYPDLAAEREAARAASREGGGAR